MDNKNGSLRERKKEKTRDTLIEVANRLFLERGFEDTTVDDIVAVADISQRTFFRYFPTKEAVVFSKHPGRVVRFRLLLARHKSAETPIKVVIEALIDFAGEYEKNKDQLLREWRIVVASPTLIVRDVELDLEFEQAIAEVLAGEKGPNSVAFSDARILAGAIFGAVRAIMQEWFGSECKSNLPELGRHALEMLDKGLSVL
ncbi:MAG: TetR family transcriptional regulator [Deltaproteobacteria bacterium]|nr:TetR family transcriptional regulator [Deltaproteobacteria bacterium]